MSWRAVAMMSVGLFLLLLVIFLTVPLFIQISVESLSYGLIEDTPSRDVAIVLGASVYGMEPSPILALRADTAATLYFKGRVKKVLITGDNSPYHKEVTAVQKYLLQGGIPTSDIMLDPDGLDTYESMYRARAVFGITSAIVVTQSFHMPRALYLARSEGIDAVGATAPGGEYQIFSYLREIPADWKALYDVSMRVIPAVPQR